MKADTNGYRKITVTTKLGYLGDFETEYWTESDWKKHRKRVKQMKKDGTFGQPHTTTLLFKEIPLLSDGGKMDFEFKDMGFIIPFNNG